MNDLGSCTWTSFIDVVKNFFGKLRGVSGKPQDIGANKSIKVHFYIAIKINFRIIAAK